RFQEIVGGNVVAVFGLHGTGEEFAVRAVAFLVHSGGREGGVVGAGNIFSGKGAGPPGAGGGYAHQKRKQFEAKKTPRKASIQPASAGKPSRSQKKDADRGKGSVGVEPAFEVVWCADFDEDDAECAAGKQEEPTDAEKPRGWAQSPTEEEYEHTERHENTKA